MNLELDHTIVQHIALGEVHNINILDKTSNFIFDCSLVCESNDTGSHIAFHIVQVIMIQPPKS